MELPILWLSYSAGRLISMFADTAAENFNCRLSAEPEPEFYKSAVLSDVQETASEPRTDNRRRASFRFFAFLRTNALHMWIPKRYYRKLPIDRYSVVRYGHCSSPGRGHLQI